MYSRKVLSLCKCFIFSEKWYDETLWSQHERRFLHRVNRTKESDLLTAENAHQEEPKGFRNQFFHVPQNQIFVSPSEKLKAQRRKCVHTLESLERHHGAHALFFLLVYVFLLLSVINKEETFFSKLFLPFELLLSY